MGGLLASNLALIAAAVLLYRLASLEYSREAAEKSMAYFVLMPTGFVFPGVLSESVFVALGIAAFYAARRGYWWQAGVFGGLAALTRPNGVLLLLPLAWLRLSDENRRARWLRCLAPLGLIPLGTATFAIYVWLLTGDLLGLAHVYAAWQRRLTNPVDLLAWGLGAPSLQLRLGAWFALGILALSFALSRVLGFAYFLVCMLAVLAPPGRRVDVAVRHAAVQPGGVAPGHGGGAGHAVSPLSTAGSGCLAILQGFLMVFWSNGSRIVM